VWALSSERIMWRKIELSHKEPVNTVTKLRAAVEKVEIPDKSIARAFNLDLAYSLYTKLLGPLGSLLSGNGHLIVVPAGALTGLPLHLLLTAPPTENGRRLESACLSRRRKDQERRLSTV